MSDSEDEGAFASADEGEDVGKTKKGQTKKQPADKKNPDVESEVKDKTTSKSVASKMKSSTTTSSKPEAKKGKERQQQKKKGKGNSQKPEKPATGNIDDPTKSSPAKDVAQAASETEESSSAFNEAKTNVNVKEATEVKEQGSLVAESTLQKSETERNEIGSGDAKEGDLSKKAGDVRKGIPSNDTTTTPQKQSISTTDVQASGNTSSDQTEKKADSGGGGWGWSNWGSSILTAASSSVQTLKTQVGDGLSTIMDTVESSLGAIDAEELAREESQRNVEAKKANTVTSQPSDDAKNEDVTQVTEKARKTETGDGEKNESEKAKDEKNPAAADEGTGGGWFSSWGVSEIAKKVQDTGKNIASKGQTLMTEGFDAVENLAAGSIDVLESIGKKTYTTLSEHDPAFKKTREYFKARTNKPNLSSVLREAKEQAEEDATATEENEEARKCHFGTQFDEFQGIAHLEALEILSNQSEKKVHSLLNSLSSSDLKIIKPVLISIKEAFEVDEGDDSDDQKEQDFSGLVSQCVSELELGSAPDKLNKVHSMVKQWMVDFETQESHEGETIKTIHQRAIQSLAELTSKGVEQFHKAGELVLMQRETDKDCHERAVSLARLTGVLCHEIGNLATKFSDCLNKIETQQEDAEDVKSLVTNIYLEATNSSTYIQDAFQLLLPVLQQAAIEHNILARQS